MQHYSLLPADADQIRAILLTQAEMQDQRINPSLELISRLKRDEPVEAADLIEDLEEGVEVFQEDSDNLKRLANIFE